jgi:hypothetical protein
MSQKSASLVKLQQNVAGLGQVVAGLDLWIAALMQVVGVEKVKVAAETLKAEIIKKAKSQQKRRVK